MLIKKLDLGQKHETFAEPTPLGLIGLAVGCAALTPIAFGLPVSPDGLKTAAMLCLLFGGGCQFLAGLMNFANKNLFGGTVLTAFSFNWIMNWWQLSQAAERLAEGGTHGTFADHNILLATDILFLAIFIVITYGFGFFSKLLFYFLLDIDLLYAAKIAKAVLHTKAMDLPIAVLTVVLGLVALWIAFASLINPTSGRTVFKIPGPMFAVKKKQAFDWSLRNAIFEVLFKHWTEFAFKSLPFDEMKARVQEKVGDRNVLPDLAYLMELGAVVVTTEQERVVNVRLSASGIDLYEQIALRKYEF
jgi:hypothetical protein